MAEPVLFTIGFTKKSAERFFGLLRDAGVRRLIDIRLRPGSQLAGFARGADLRYFLDRLCGIGYEHRPELAPDAPLLTAYRKKQVGWDEYERRYLELVRTRDAAAGFDAVALDRSCLLCSEPTADRCHRRLAAQYLCETNGPLTICHL